MKPKKILCAVACGLAAVIITGCGTLDKLYKQNPVVIPAATNTVAVVTPAATNQVATVATNDAGAVLTNVTVTVVAPVTNYVQKITPASTNMELAPNPIVQAGISTGGNVASGMGLPFAGAGAIALGWLYTGYANLRNKKITAALVTGIEAGRQILQTTPEGQALDAKIKDALIQHQQVAGVLNEVSTLVNNLTDNTVK